MFNMDDADTLTLFQLFIIYESWRAAETFTATFVRVELNKLSI